MYNQQLKFLAPLLISGNDDENAMDIDLGAVGKFLAGRRIHKYKAMNNEVL